MTVVTKLTIFGVRLFYVYQENDICISRQFNDDVRRFPYAASQREFLNRQGTNVEVLE